MPVFQCELQWIDIDQSQAITLLFFDSVDLSAALSKAALIADNVQQFTGLRLVDVRLSVHLSPTTLIEAPSLSIRQRLVLWCDTTDDPTLGRPYRFKSILYGPKPEILSTDGLTFASSNPESQSFINNVLSHTTDIRGNPFNKVVRGVVTMIGH